MPFFTTLGHSCVPREVPEHSKRLFSCICLHFSGWLRGHCLHITEHYNGQHLQTPALPTRCLRRQGRLAANKPLLSAISRLLPFARLSFFFFCHQLAK